MNQRDDELARIAREMEELSAEIREANEKERIAAERERAAYRAHCEDVTTALLARIAELAPAADAWVESWRCGPRYEAIRRQLPRGGSRFELPILRTDAAAPTFAHEDAELAGHRSGRGVAITIRRTDVLFTHCAWTRGYGGEQRELVAVERLIQLCDPDRLAKAGRIGDRVTLLSVAARFLEIAVDGTIDDVIAHVIREDLALRRRRLEAQRELAAMDLGASEPGGDE